MHVYDAVLRRLHIACYESSISWVLSKKPDKSVSHFPAPALAHHEQAVQAIIEDLVTFIVMYIYHLVPKVLVLNLLCMTCIPLLFQVPLAEYGYHICIRHHATLPHYF